MFSSNGPNNSLVAPGDARWSAGMADPANTPDARLAVRLAQWARYQTQRHTKPCQNNVTEQSQDGASSADKHLYKGRGEWTIACIR